MIYSCHGFVVTDSAVRERRVMDPKMASAADSKYSVQALAILAEVRITTVKCAQYEHGTW